MQGGMKNLTTALAGSLLSMPPAISWYQIISFGQVCLDNPRSPPHPMAVVTSFGELTVIYLIQTRQHKRLCHLCQGTRAHETFTSQHLLFLASLLSSSCSCPALELLSVNRMTALEKHKKTEHKPILFLQTHLHCISTGCPQHLVILPLVCQPIFQF